MKIVKHRGFLFVVVAFLVFSGCFSVPEAQSTDTGFGYRMQITVNSNQVTGTQTNFPFLFSTTNADTTAVKNKLRTVANGGHVASTKGYDIIFRAKDSTTCGALWNGNDCKLSHEIEKYDSTTGEFIAWVNVPSITNGTVLYVYYGAARRTHRPAAGVSFLSLRNLHFYRRILLHE